MFAVDVSLGIIEKAKKSEKKRGTLQFDRTPSDREGFTKQFWKFIL